MDHRFDQKQTASGGLPDDQAIAPIPRVAIQAFCETPDVAGAVHAASSDRRMNKAHVKIQMGGSAAAVEAYRNAPTPNVIIIEAVGDRQQLLDALDTLSSVCDPGTKVVVIGHVNDVILYRELMRRGVSEYMIAPVDVMEVLRSISELFGAPGADPLGRIIAFVGAKGGVGASTICHNVAWAVASNHAVATVIVDLDIPFGTAGLDFNQDPPQGIADAIFTPDRLDANFVDRLLSKCTDNLSLLAAPAMLDRTCDFSETAIDHVIDLLRSSVPAIFLDVPHVWSAWTRRTLIAADDIFIVAEPELASLRNAKNLYDTLRQARPNDHKPKILLNCVGTPKRPEISASDFNKAIGTEVVSTIAFDAALFGTASNNGQMIAEIQPMGRTTESFSELGSMAMGRVEPKRMKRTLFDPIMSRLSMKKA
jgi:pilus assembly protein CpaE